MPFSTLVTKSSANDPKSWTDVMSQGPLMPLPAQVSTGTPLLFSTMRQPASGVPEPFSVTGRLPTITYPSPSTLSAVVSPTPPGHPGRVGSTCAKTLAPPAGETCTMVVPVPWVLLLELKLLTSVSPPTRLPVLKGTLATP